MTHRFIKPTLATATVLAAIGLAAAPAAATSEPASPASSSVGEGTVVSIELDDDGRYDADVTLDDGGELEVHLDDTFDVVRTERDDD